MLSTSKTTLLIMGEVQILLKALKNTNIDFKAFIFQLFKPNYSVIWSIWKTKMHKICNQVTEKRSFTCADATSKRKSSCASTAALVSEKVKKSLVLQRSCSEKAPVGRSVEIFLPGPDLLEKLAKLAGKSIR